MKPSSTSPNSAKTVDPDLLDPLSVLEAIRDGLLPGSSMGATIPMEIKQVSVGEVYLRIAPDARHLNPAGAVHGGFAAACLDSAAALALYSSLATNDNYATIDLGIKYLRPLARGQHYTAVGQLLERTKQLGICTARIVDAAGKCFAFASATFLVTAAAEETVHA